MRAGSEPGAAAGGAATGTARIQRRTVAVLSAAQVVGGLGVGSGLAVGALVAEEISGSASWAGLATTMITLGAALFALPLAGAAARRGRRVGLTLGWLTAASGAAVVLAAAQLGIFPLFLTGMVLFGAGTATNLQSRYAAADLAADRTRARDLSLVVWATTVGAVTGPNLTGPGAAAASWLGLPALAGPFVFSAAAFAVAAAATGLALRPDPLLVARQGDGGTATGASARSGGLRGSLAAVAASPAATLALVAIALSHGLMVMVMTMTPVHMSHGGAALTVVGLTISLHIAGMYALSPVVGWLADRVGRVPVLLAGQGILLASAAVSAAAGPSEAQLTLGLILLGLGWSFAVVAGSALLSESLEPRVKPGAQGASDLLMNLAGAGCGALSGVLLAAVGFTGLNVVAAALAVPVVLLALRLWRREGMAATTPPG